MVENLGQWIPKLAPSPNIIRPAPGESSARIRVIVGEEYLWDVDATNPNGGTLRFSLAPIPYGLSSVQLTSAPYATGITVEPVTGFLRWVPSAAGLFTARLSVVDGKANQGSYYDLAFQVDPPATANTPLACTDYVANTFQGQTTPIRYLQSRDGTNSLPAVAITPGRSANCSLGSGVALGEGKYPVTCDTNDGLWPKASCKFNVTVNRVGGAHPRRVRRAATARRATRS